MLRPKGGTPYGDTTAETSSRTLTRREGGQFLITKSDAQGAADWLSVLPPDYLPPGILAPSNQLRLSDSPAKAFKEQTCRHWMPGSPLTNLPRDRQRSKPKAIRPRWLRKPLATKPYLESQLLLLRMTNILGITTKGLPIVFLSRKGFSHDHFLYCS